MRSVRKERKAAIEACRRRGGHFWHASGMTAWSCCACPANTEGNPKDGPGLHPRHTRAGVEW
jgi:hypothetical protein